MNTKGKELFFNRCKEYFDKNYDEFINLLNNKPSSGFFLNEKKADREKIFSIVDFSYKSSKLTDKSFYCLDEAIGKTKAYELGIIYPQDIESSISANFVDTLNVKLAIDLCAAPGGKSINILNRLSNDSLLISNDISYKRVSILASNLERLGLDNTIITCLKPEYFVDNFSSIFDLVILDAPCSGEGMIRKYSEILDDYNIGNIESLASIQKELLENAYCLLKKGGQLIYSTCTYAFEEDENQIEDFLKRHEDIELVDIDIDDINSSKLKGTIKLSFLNNTEGQFIALMRKTDGDNGVVSYKKTVKNKIVEKFINENLLINNYYLYSAENRFYLSFIPLININKHFLNEGIYLGELKKDRFEPSFSLYRANSLKGKYKKIYELKDSEYDLYVSGNELKSNLSDGYYLITYKDLSLGYVKCSKGSMKNKYPKGLRRMV